MADGVQNPSANSGSRWHRWEPHIHAPGTIFNDQFGKDAWEKYIKILLASSPPIRAIGVTDYYLTDSYEALRALWTEGKLPGVELVFPNIEMRFDIGTKNNRDVNLHLLVSPQDPDHVDHLNRFMSRLTFKVKKDTYDCTKPELIRLGNLAASDQRLSIAADDTASFVKLGAQQFKVNLDQLRESYNGSEWARSNILIAVSGNSNDGSSGVNDPADAMLRKEIDAFAHVIFASSPKQREFWLGYCDVSKEELHSRFGGTKPCLHGSDAHQLATVGKPELERYTWLKGGIHFDSLRQACIEPEGRCCIGMEPPMGASPSQVIQTVEVSNAPWAKTPQLSLNPGLVAIIGARGSGKTALADMIALGCDAMEPVLEDPDELPTHPSFLYRAREYLSGSAVILKWSDETVTRDLDSLEPEPFFEPRARYLSQKFVEDLCSARGMTDRLLAEIQRVIYQANPNSETDGASDFEELLTLRASRHREAREREELSLVELSERLATEIEKKNSVAGLKKQIADKTKLINGYTTDRGKLVVKGSEKKVERLAELTGAETKLQGYVRYYTNQELALLGLNDEVENMRSAKAPEMLRQSRDKFLASRMDDEEWKSFLLKYTGNVDDQLTKKLAHCRKETKRWKGEPVVAKFDPDVSYLFEDVALEEQTVCILEAEIARLTKSVSADRQTREKYSALTKLITKETTARDQLSERLSDAEGAAGRIPELVAERTAAYLRVFEAIIKEHDVLVSLYEPLASRLKTNGGTLQKLSFSVNRKVDVETWSEKGQSLVDLRFSSPVKGRGKLQERAEEFLLGAWQNGTAQEVSVAMDVFRAATEQGLLQHAKEVDPASYRSWARDYANPDISSLKQKVSEVPAVSCYG